MEDLIALVTRLSLRDHKTLSQKSLKLSEESGELARAVLAYEGAGACNHRFPSRDKIVEECADSMLVAYSIAKSLGVSDTELLAELTRKARYWEELQNAEEATDLSALQFEVHITVESTTNLQTFRKDCGDIGVKPIILDLYTTGEPILDVMTSSHFTGTTKEATLYSKGIVAALAQRGYRVVREKIETVPWHPASKQAHHDPSPSRYFEAHLAFDIDTPTDTLMPFLRRHSIRLSRNKMKKNDHAVIMGTYRVDSHKTDVGNFLASVNGIVSEASDLGIIIEERPETEFALFDSSSDHDAVWISGR